MHFNTVSSLSVLAATALAAPSQPRNAPIPTDGGFKFGCNTAPHAVTIVLPGDGTKNKAGRFDAPGHCGRGVLDNLHGQGLVINDWGCTYVGKNTAEIQFTCEVYEPYQIVRAINAATGQHLDENTACSADLLDEPSKREEAQTPQKRGGPLPKDGKIAFSCEVESQAVPPIDSYRIVLPGDGNGKVKGFDAPGNCGRGVLDNMHGQALTPSSWGCKYVGKNSAEITFNLELGASAEVERAINAATGSQEAMCSYKEELDGADPALTGDNPIAGVGV